VIFNAKILLLLALNTYNLLILSLRALSVLRCAVEYLHLSLRVV
jgi:hypothetical protein